MIGTDDRALGSDDVASFSTRRGRDGRNAGITNVFLQTDTTLASSGQFPTTVPLRRDHRPRVGFFVTNLESDSRVVVRFYNKRGTAERWIKEGKQAVKMTRLSCHRCRSIQPGQSLAAAGAAEEDRELVADEFTEAAVKTGARLVKHARYYWLLLAESQLTQRLFGSIVRRIEALPVPAG
jgi:hypothetical protein